MGCLHQGHESAIGLGGGDQHYNCSAQVRFSDFLLPLFFSFLLLHLTIFLNLSFSIFFFSSDLSFPALTKKRDRFEERERGGSKIDLEKERKIKVIRASSGFGE